VWFVSSDDENLIVVSVVAWIATVPGTIHEAVTDALIAFDLWSKVGVTILMADEDRILSSVLDKVSDEAHFKERCFLSIVFHSECHLRATNAGGVITELSLESLILELIRQPEYCILS
jgi:hypothetical protein